MRRCWPPDQRLQVPAAGRGLEQVFGRQGARRYDPTYLSTSVYIYISVCLSIYLYISICLFIIYLSIYLSTISQPSIKLPIESINLINQSIYQSYQPINLSILSILSIYQFIHRSTYHQSIHPPIHQSIDRINPSILSILSTHQSYQSYQPINLINLINHTYQSYQ